MSGCTCFGREDVSNVPRRGQYFKRKGFGKVPSVIRVSDACAQLNEVCYMCLRTFLGSKAGMATSISWTRTSDDEQPLKRAREACEASSFPLSRETTRGFVTPRNRQPPATLTDRPSRTASPLRDVTAPARVLTERGSHSPCMGKVPSFWSKPAGPARPFLERCERYASAGGASLLQDVSESVLERNA